MKKVSVLLVPILLSVLAGCDKNEPIMTIFVASDLHMLSDKLVEGNEVYTKDIFTTDGRVQEFDVSLLNEFINQINIEKPDYVFLTGDLSFNGEKQSHEDIANMLSSVNESTKVLVIPGNHDIYNLNSRTFVGDKAKKIKGTKPNEFKDIYKNYGYENALYYDEGSLSYIYALNDKTWAIMLDSNNTEYNIDLGTNIVGGFIEPTTITWLKEKLEIAKQNNIELISTTHHNLLVHNPLFESMYTIYNYQELLDIYSEYDVKVNFSGHLHIQSIKESNGIYDIASGSLLDYGNKFGKFEIYEDKYYYEAINLDISTETFNFKEYSFNTFYSEYYNKSVVGNKNKYGEFAEQITDLLAKINTYYFDGDYKTISKLVSENQELINLVKSGNDAYAKSLIDVEDKNQNKLEIILNK